MFVEIPDPIAPATVAARFFLQRYFSIYLFSNFVLGTHRSKSFISVSNSTYLIVPREFACCIVNTRTARFYKYRPRSRKRRKIQFQSTHACVESAANV